MTCELLRSCALFPQVRMTMVAAKFQGWLAEPGRAQELKDVKKGNL